MKVAMHSDSTTEWFALQVKLRYESFTASLLASKGYEVFSPTYPLDLSAGSRRIRTEKALFPGYFFSRFDFTRRLPILMTPGISGIVSYGKMPAAIPEAEILAIKSVISAKLELEPCSFLGVGLRVRVIDGPLANYEGIVLEHRSVCRLVLSISAIQRSVRVEVNRESVLPLDSLESSLVVPVRPSLQMS